MSDREDFQRAVGAVSEPDPYSLIWPAEVVVQNTDGTLDLAVKEGPLAGEYLGVTFRPGLASYQMIAPGELVEIAFEGGKPDGLFAFTRKFRQGEGTMRVARAGDPIDIGWLLVTAPPGGGTCTLAITAFAVPGSIHLTGTITDGSPTLKIP
jgi:hypothetical protein